MRNLIILMASAIALSACAPCEDEYCEAQRDRGVALMGIGAQLMSRPAYSTVNCTQMGNFTSCQQW